MLPSEASYFAVVANHSAPLPSSDHISSPTRWPPSVFDRACRDRSFGSRPAFPRVNNFPSESNSIQHRRRSLSGVQVRHSSNLRGGRSIAADVAYSLGDEYMILESTHTPPISPVTPTAGQWLWPGGIDFVVRPCYFARWRRWNESLQARLLNIAQILALLIKRVVTAIPPSRPLIQITSGGRR